MFLAVGQAVFQERLTSELYQVVPTDVVNAVISVGATRIRSVVSPQDLAVVLRAYSSAVTQVFVCTPDLRSESSWLTLIEYIPAAAPVISFLLICFTEWISIRKPETKKPEGGLFEAEV